MQFTLLGCGTSTGVPLPGCSCKVCTSGDPFNHRDRTSGLITLDNGANILIDAGPDLRQQALKHRIPSIEAVIYTHAHADHILGTDDLRTFNFVTKKRIPCYGTRSTLDGVQRCFSYIFDPDPTYEGGLLAQLDLEEISNEAPFTIHGATFIPFPLHHGRMTVTGFRIGELGYATDFSTLSERAREILHGVKYLFIDGLRYEPHPTHITIPEAVRLAQELKAQRSYIIHTTHTIDYHETNAQLPSGIELGYDGLSLSFG